MAQAVAVGATARLCTAPRPWVGAVLVSAGGAVFGGATDGQRGPHAEIVALRAAGPEAARGATVYATLEPCSHHGVTPPCADALVDAGVDRVVVGTVDPDPKVAGQGIARLRAAGIDVRVGVGAAAVERQLRPYLHQRRTGRPYVVLKLAATLDGRTAAPDRTSQWITGPEARADAHLLRAESDAVVVGSGTVASDDPALTVRTLPPAQAAWPRKADPRRIVLGDPPPATARIHPCEAWRGSLPDLLDRLGAEGVIQVLVEGGAAVAHSVHRQGLVDRYALYLAPALFGGDDALGLFRGAGAPTMAALWRGRIDGVVHLGADLRIDVLPGPAA
jgi:diaminohydroxyphosphoribosylaminopyrimidine deaminase/5-amino-6-(5-phosphoribosylamino)uracil reductase